MEFGDYRVPTRVAGGDVVRVNGGQAVEAGLRAVQVGFGDRAVEGVQRRRRDALECVVPFGDPSPIGVGEGRRAAVDEVAGALTKAERQRDIAVG